MKVASKYGLLIVLILTAGCRQKLAPAAYMQYVQDVKNGMRKTVKVAGWEYSVQYRPADLIMLIESKGVYNSSYAVKRMAQLKGTAWFNISFRLADGKVSPLRYDLSSRQEYDERLNYFLNEAGRCIKLVCCGKDTLRPMSYLFENNYNLTPQETMIVGFQLPSGTSAAEDDMQLCYEDHVFRNGTIKALFRKEDLQNIPKLIY
jgi:hypothetical protein